MKQLIETRQNKKYYNRHNIILNYTGANFGNIPFSLKFAGITVYWCILNCHATLYNSLFK